jgi:hypothetical protein
MKKINIGDRPDSRTKEIIRIMNSYNYECDVEQANYLLNKWIQDLSCWKSFDEFSDIELVDFFRKHFWTDD